MTWPWLVAALLTHAVIGAGVAGACFRPIVAWGAPRDNDAVFAAAAWLGALGVALVAGLVWPATAVVHAARRTR